MEYVSHTRDRVASICDEIAAWSLVAIVAGLPLAFNPWGHAFFEMPKMELFRLATMVAVTAWVTKVILTGRLTWVKTPLDWPLLALVVSASISTVLATDRHISFYGRLNRFNGLLSLVCFVALFYVAVNLVDTKRRLRRILVAFLVGAGVVSLIAVFERFALYLLPGPIAAGGVDPTRPSATYGNPIHLGAFLVLALPATIALTLYLRVRLVESTDADRSRQALTQALWAAAGLATLEAAALVFTQGRAAWLGAVFGLAVIAVLSWRDRAALGRRYLAGGLLAVLAAASIYAAAAASPRAPVSEPLWTRAESIANPASGTAFNRLYIWKMTVPIVMARPVFGHGLDFYLELFPRWRPKDWYRSIKENAIPAEPHNDMLQVAVGQGLVGLAAYLVVLAVFFVAVVGGVRRTKSAMRRYVLVGVAAAVVAYVVQLQFSFGVNGVVPLFWIAAGLGTAFAGADRRKSRTLVVEPSVLQSWRPTAALAARLASLIVVAALVAWGAVGLGKAMASDMYLRAAQEAYNQGSLAESLALFKRTVAINPYETKFPTEAAQAMEAAYVHTRDTSYADAGIAFARQAQILDPYLTEPLSIEASVYRDMAGRAGSRPLRRAETLYRRVIALDRYNEAAHFNLGITLYDLESFKGAAAQLRTAAQLNPDDSEAFVALGAALVKLGRLDDAKRVLETAIKLNPGSSYARQQLESINAQSRRTRRRT